MKEYAPEEGTAEDLAGRRREEERDDELENFERRRRWFAEFHSAGTGWTSTKVLRNALRQAERLDAAAALGDRDPGGSAPDDVEVADERVAQFARVGRSDGRVERDAFFGVEVEVDFDEVEAPYGIPVKVALREPRTDLDLGTARMFLRDEETGRWQLVRRSGVAADGSYAWLHAHRPGRYALAGLPADPAAGAALLTLGAFRDQLGAAARREAIGDAVEAIGRAVLGAGTMLAMGGQAPAGFGGDFGGGFGEGGFDGDFGEDGFDGNDFQGHLERYGRELPGDGLVEWDILDDICPPWPWFPPKKKWMPHIPDLPGKWPHTWPWPPRLPYPWPFKNVWQSAGPRNVNGRIKSLAIHPSDGSILWAGAANGGVWKTNDGGAKWFPLWSQELALSVGALAVAPSDPDVLYAATGEDTPGWVPSWPGVGVYRTNDGGSTWDLMTPPGSSRCTKVLVHPTDPKVVYVAGDGGLHRSTDGGTTWTNVRTDHVCDALLDRDDPARIYAAVWNDRVYRSVDAGSTWTDASTGLPTGADAQWIKLAMGRGGPNKTKLLLAKLGLDSGAIYRSTDGGGSWSLVASPVQPVSYNEWTNAISVDPKDENRILAAGVGLSLSTDGTTFAGVGGTHSDHHQVVYDPNDSQVVYLATDGGVYRSTDGGASWSLRSYALVATQLYSIGVSQGPTLRVGGGTQDQGVIATGASADWVDTGAGNEGGFFVVDPNDDDNVYVTPWWPGLRRSTDGGATWTSIQNGLPGDSVSDLAVRPGDSDELVAVVGTDFLASGDRGTTWTSAGTLPGAGWGEGLTRVAFAPSSSTVCYAATNQGRVFRSATSGAAGGWAEPYAAADRPPVGVVAAIAVSHANPDRLYIGYAGFGLAHVWRSADGGAHWTAAAGSGVSTLPDIPVNALVVDNLNADVVFAATDIGVFRTTDGGVTWATYGLGMPRAFVSGLVLRRSTRTLYASTMGRGAYRRRVYP